MQRPREPRGDQVAHDLPADRPAPPGRPDHRDGRRAQNVLHGRDVGLALALLEAPPRVPRQRRRELDLDRIPRPAGGDEKPGFVEHTEHPVVPRQDGRGERLHTRRRRGMGEMREQHRGDPVTMPRIGHREGHLRPPRRLADVGAVRDDRALRSPEREQRQPVAGDGGAAAAALRLTPALKNRNQRDSSDSAARNARNRGTSSTVDGRTCTVEPSRSTTSVSAATPAMRPPPSSRKDPWTAAGRSRTWPPAR